MIFQKHKFKKWRRRSILYKTTSIRKNSWQLNHSRVSGARGRYRAQTLTTRPRYVYNVGVQSNQDENCLVIVCWIAKRCHYLSSIYLPPCRFFGGVRVYMAWSQYMRPKKMFIAAGRDAFRGRLFFYQGL